MRIIKKIKVLVIEDSILFRKLLVEHINSFNQFEVVGAFSDAINASEKIDELKPDVITLDVEMPKMSGIEFLRRIIPKSHIPVVVVSQINISVFDAIKYGAVDFIKKPESKNDMDIKIFMNELARKLFIASKVKVVSNKQSTNIKSLNMQQSIPVIIGIGASTGGTEAILEVVKDLPQETPPILVVQHMPKGFTKMYAERLNKICKMNVKEAENGDKIKNGTIFIAPGEKHMSVTANSTGGYVIRCFDGERVSGHIPSVDVLFESISKIKNIYQIGVIMTGMGRDGANGLLDIKNSSGYTLGQDKDTSVVYGMPMVANEIGAVKKQVALLDIANNIIEYLNTL